MSTGKIIGDHRYLIEGLIAKGTFSNVHRCVDLTTDKVYAVKVISKSVIESQNMSVTVVREVSAMEAAPPSPYLVRLVDKLVSSRNYYLVMNVVEGCTLLDVIEKKYRPRPPLRWVRSIFRQLLNGLYTLHGANVVHRDIKPENLLLNRSYTRLVISDFGFACCAPPGRSLHHSCGTMNYCAPELLVPKPAYDGRKVDVWAAGVTLYVMIFGVHPFQARKEGCADSLAEVITSGAYTLPHSLQPELEHLLSVMLEPDPALRWSVRKLLRHVWVLGGMVGGVTGRSSLRLTTPTPGSTGVANRDANTPEDYVVRSRFARALRADDTDPSARQFRSCPDLRREMNNFLDACDSDGEDAEWDGDFSNGNSTHDGYTKFSSLNVSLTDIGRGRQPSDLDGFSESTAFATNGSYSSLFSADQLLLDPDETPDTPKGDFLLTVRVIVNFALFCTTLVIVAALRFLFDVPVRDLPLPPFVISIMEYLLVPPHERLAQSFEVRRMRHRFPCAALRRLVASAERAIQRSSWCRRIMPVRGVDEGTDVPLGTGRRGIVLRWLEKN
ncbi:protein kinase, putative [Trypanosoma brucei gambiense DAL972]|uniref:Protein kinase, putative n=1 Tax=Trypanosoma brucei gambiense (strain MHOM/CI/86/DAL972) TaxID=679716 RepID=D0A879_TRYB9|nr:protein kinase, putative [Trypanosoma brucei gambiense DAL972]CBH17880.1 protein kinase, putative [Trypanosoma brucei gambiense DAL972]|eukprot:XP_011780144.1 protein kinase, putative [Trypanosoma brucei gambiense DAL972]